jgi:hypothetical protein
MQVANYEKKFFYPQGFSSFFASKTFAKIYDEFNEL